MQSFPAGIPSFCQHAINMPLLGSNMQSFPPFSQPFTIFTVFTISRFFHHLPPRFSISNILPTFPSFPAFQHSSSTVPTFTTCSSISSMLPFLQRFAMFCYVWRGLPSLASLPRSAAFAYFATFTFPILVSWFSVI